MSKQRPCRGCGAEFTMTTKGQRYCATCREVRAAAQAVLAANKRCCCGHVGADVKRGVCPTCKAAKRAAERAEVERIRQQKLARYGVCTQCDEPQSRYRDGLCLTCRAKANQARIRQQRRADHQARLDARAEARQDNDDFFVWLETLPDDEFYEAYNALRHAVAELGITMAPIRAQSQPEKVHPEEQPHADQDAIDRTFRDLMKGIDL